MEAERRGLLFRLTGYVAIVSLPFIILLALEGTTRLYARVFGNPDEVWHGWPDPSTWPDPGISSPEFHALVDDQYGSFGDYYAYTDFPTPDRITWTDVPVQINRFGLRGAEFDLEKRPGKFRLVAMGESSTFGFMADNDEVYPVVLQTLLDERLGADQVEVINAGLPYYTTEDMAILLEHLVARMDPDLVTFYIGYNDASWLTRTLLERRMRRGTGTFRRGAIAARTFLLDHSLLLNKVARRLDVPLRSFTISDQSFPRMDAAETTAFLDAVVDEFALRLSALHQQACTAGIDHVFITQLHAPLEMWTGTMERDDDPLTFMAREAQGGTYYDYASVVRDKASAVGADRPVELFWMAQHRINQWMLGQPALRTLDFVDHVGGDFGHLATIIHLNAAGNVALAGFLAGAVQATIASGDTASVRAGCVTTPATPSNANPASGR